MRLKKISTGTLILAGLAAFAYYRYCRMSEEQKNNFIYRLREKGKKLSECYIPGSLRNFFVREENMFYDENSGEHSDYYF
jgi:hypothetical protein